MIKKLKIYENEEHSHGAQKPVTLEVNKMHKTYGTGRRRHNARVYLYSGTGEIKINSQDVDRLYKINSLSAYLLAPLTKTQMQDKEI